MFEEWFAGSTGDPPFPSGDSPDGAGATVRANGLGLFATLLAAVPVGGSPTGAVGSPAPPIFKTGSEHVVVLHRMRDWTLDAAHTPGAMGMMRSDGESPKLTP